MARTTNDRIAGVLVAAVGLLGVLWLRCLWLQTVEAPRYQRVAASQHWASEPARARRGTIYDRYEAPLVMSAPAPSVYANARQVKAKATMAKRLAKLVGKDEQAIRGRLERDRGFIWLARQVSPEVTPVLRTMRRDGVGFVEEFKRVYPHGKMAAHLLGFVNIDHQGLEGLELQHNGLLRGSDGWRSTLRDARGKPLVGPWTTALDPVDGMETVLTIDRVVQQVAEAALELGVKKYHAKGGTILVMDPHTGEILAMAVQPSFDPSHPSRSEMETRRNRAVTDVFEPGSTFKIIAAAALLEEGRISLNDPIYCENGNYKTVGRHVLHDHRPHGTMPFRDVIKYSSNIGTAKAAQRLTPEEYYGYVRAFGIGERTGIDLPGEVRGILPKPSAWSKLTPFIMPIGQEVAVTPVQLAVMASVIANGGYRVQPYVLSRVQTPEGRVVRAHQAQAPVRVISRQTAETLQQVLASVVESGTGQTASVQGLTVAGKTGTAQKLEPDGRYSHSRFVASFVGFGPVPDPTFVIVVNLDEPRPLYFGGVVAAPLFRQVVEQLASYWELPRQPREPVQVAARIAPSGALEPD